MKKIVFIEKDEHNAIAVCKDNFKGIVVQIIRFVDQVVPSGPNNVNTNIRNHSVIKQIAVPVANEKGMNEDFRLCVDKAIKEAREYVAVLHQQDNKIDGLMKDLLSQNKGINEHKE